MYKARLLAYGHADRRQLLFEDVQQPRDTKRWSQRGCLNSAPNGDGPTEFDKRIIFIHPILSRVSHVLAVCEFTQHDSQMDLADSAQIERR